MNDPKFMNYRVGGAESWVRGRSDATRTICVCVCARVLSVVQRSGDLRGERSKVAHQLICLLLLVFLMFNFDTHVQVW